MSDEMSGMVATLELMRERRRAYHVRADLCIAALDGLTNEQVGKLADVFAAIRDLKAMWTFADDGDVVSRAGAIISAARAAGIIKE